MGIPRFFRWITERYPLALEFVIGETCEPNKKWDRTTGEQCESGAVPAVYEEYDNLYLDMNGIIHGCTHEADGKFSFEITTANVFKCISKIVAVIRPRKLLFIAIDGVAPRSKMNQQRSRRFNADRERNSAAAATEGENSSSDSDKPVSDFNSNAISPGTEFMEKLNQALQAFIAMKQSEDPIWKKLCIVYSGHNVPGEGEHKILDFIRKLRVQPNYNPETSHCIYGPDADLILLGLGTHEKYVSILREETISREAIKRNKGRGIPNKFQVVHLAMIREYIELEFRPAFVKRKFEVNRVVDDFIAIMCFIGNDFLPGLPGIGIEENSVETMFSIYKECIDSFTGYLTDGNTINASNFSVFLKMFINALTDVSIGDALRKLDSEDAVSTKNLGNDDDKDPVFITDDHSAYLVDGDDDDEDYDELLSGVSSKKNKDDFFVNDDFADDDDDFGDNYINDNDGGDYMDDDDELMELMGGPINLSDDDNDDNDDNDESVLKKESSSLSSNSVYRDAYYVEKFGPENGLSNKKFHTKLAHDFLDGIVWTLTYYYKGCPSWEWFYPYHYAPFLEEIARHLSDWKAPKFTIGAPFLPFQQLLSILPAQSCELVPETYRWLMMDPKSPILDFYPVDFKKDQNGKRNEWESVILIPFISAERLISAVALAEKKQPLKPEEAARNVNRTPMMFSYTEESLGEKQSPVPDAVPFTFELHSRVQDVSDSFEEVWTVHKMEADHAKHFSPSLFNGLKYSASFIPVGVQLHIHQTRDLSCTLTIKKEDSENEANLMNIAKELVGKPVFYNWPYVWEGKVKAVYSSTTSVSMDEEEKVLKEEKLKKTAPWKSYIYTLKEAIKTNSAILFDDPTIVLEVRPMWSMAVNKDGTLTKDYGASSLFIPYSLALRDLHEKNPRFNMEKYSFYSHGNSVLIWEKVESGEVKLNLGYVESAGEAPTVVVREALVNVENRFKAEEEKADDTNEKWYTMKEMCEKIQCSELALKKIIDYVSYAPGYFKLGLGIYDNFRTKYNPNYCRYKKETESIEYNELLVKILSDYKAAFPSVFEATGDKKKAGKTASLAESPEEAERIAKSAEKWVSNLHLSHTMIATSVDILSGKQIAQIRDAKPPVWSPSEKKTIQPGSNVVFSIPSGLSFKVRWEERPSTTVVLGDRVVNTFDNGVVPFGAVGTVISIKKNDIEVLFDKPFFSGSDLTGICPNFTGSLCRIFDLINLSNL